MLFSFHNARPAVWCQFSGRSTQEQPCQGPVKSLHQVRGIWGRRTLDVRGARLRDPNHPMFVASGSPGPGQVDQRASRQPGNRGVGFHIIEKGKNANANQCANAMQMRIAINLFVQMRCECKFQFALPALVSKPEFEIVISVVEYQLFTYS
jgi:hypothetical protein